jgi:hypothetical protein
MIQAKGLHDVHAIKPGMRCHGFRDVAGNARPHLRHPHSKLPALHNEWFVCPGGGQVKIRGTDHEVVEGFPILAGNMHDQMDMIALPFAAFSCPTEVLRKSTRSHPTVHLGE